MLFLRIRIRIRTRQKILVLVLVLILEILRIPNDICALFFVTFLFGCSSFFWPSRLPFFPLTFFAPPPYLKMTGPPESSSSNLEQDKVALPAPEPISVIMPDGKRENLYGPLSLIGTSEKPNIRVTSSPHNDSRR